MMRPLWQLAFPATSLAANMVSAISRGLGRRLQEGTQPLPTSSFFLLHRDSGHILLSCKREGPQAPLQAGGFGQVTDDATGLRQQGQPAPVGFPLVRQTRESPCTGE